MKKRQSLLTSEWCKSRGKGEFEITWSEFSKIGLKGHVLVFLWSSINDGNGVNSSFGNRG